MARVVDALQDGDGVAELVDLDIERHLGRQAVRVAHDLDRPRNAAFPTRPTSRDVWHPRPCAPVTAGGHSFFTTEASSLTTSVTSG